MKTALLVIDMQRGFIEPQSSQCIRGAAATVPNCARVIRHCRENDVPVIFVTRAYRSDGSDVEHTRFKKWRDGGKPMSPDCDESISAALPDEFGSDERDYHIIKPRFSAFFATGLDMLLRRLGVDTLVLTGTTTPNCIRTTCYDAISLDYNTVVIDDCTSSMNDEIQSSNIRDMAKIGAQIFTADEFISGREIRDTAGWARENVGK